MTDAGSGDSGKREQLLALLRTEEETVRELVVISRGLKDRPGGLDIEATEELIRQRATGVERLAQLEQDRLLLLGASNAADDEVRNYHRRIRDSLDALLALDEGLQDNLRRAQYQAINNVVSRPKYLNFSPTTSFEQHAGHRVVDVMR
ncbi:MAG: hypothetical protein IID13_05100 [Candidatus Marinimicrobia bacterium]|nr:hypothetical protein [Candidatus Neomarinimicrobiota bacterium]